MAVVSSRTNGFLFSDLRNYTKFVEAHGDAAAAAYLDRYRRLVRREVAEFGGAEIKTEGDSFYVVFPSASSAVQCGLAIVRATADEARETGEAPITVGVGVHAGETVETEEGYVGSAVNIAARVCSQAAAGEVLVTDTVRGLIRTSAAVRFVERGQRKLKGIEEPVALYRVEPLGEGHHHGTDRKRRLTDVGSRTKVGLLALTAVIVGGVGAAAFLNGNRATAGPTAAPGASPTLAAIGSGIPSPTPSPSPTPTSTAPPDDELLAQLPSDLVGCAPTETASERHGNVASVRCDLPLSDQAETVWYDRFDSLQQVASEMFGIVDKENLKPGVDCTRDQTRGQGPWKVGSTHSGQLLCYASGDRLWVVWSYDAERIVARAVRSGDTTEDWQALYDWWSQVRLFLR